VSFAPTAVIATACSHSLSARQPPIGAMHDSLTQTLPHTFTSGPAHRCGWRQTEFILHLYRGTRRSAGGCTRRSAGGRLASTGCRRGTWPQRDASASSSAECPAPCALPLSSTSRARHMDRNPGQCFLVAVREERMCAGERLRRQFIFSEAICTICSLYGMQCETAQRHPQHCTGTTFDTGMQHDIAP